MTDLLPAPAAFRLDNLRTTPPDTISKDGIAADLTALRQELEDLQSRLYASRKAAVLLLLQGLDTSGKDGTIRKVFDTVNPLGLDIQAFKQPTPEEQAHDFLWRAHRRTPARGFIGIFNRSYYEAAISDHVEGLIDDAERQRRCHHIRHFEDMLQDNGTVLVKCMLHISKAEQKKRLVERLEDPAKHWKFSSTDLLTRSRWDDFQKAYGAVLQETSTEQNPWHVIPADKKWYRDYLVTQLLVQALRGINPEYPALREKISAADIGD